MSRIPDFISPDQASKCEWGKRDESGVPKKSPHIEHIYKERPLIMNNILEAVGISPLVQLHKIPESEGLKCNLYGKCEFLNPGGSVKDRIGYRMVLEAEASNLIRPNEGYTIIEPTSGNTGIGIAMACAVKGYNCIIVMPDKMSNEKVDALRLLGAKIIRTPIEAEYWSPESLISVAQLERRRIGAKAVILDQYRNPYNPIAHYDGTAEEILWQCPDVDMVVIGAGTGGTVTGIGRKIKEKRPNCKIIAVDPEGSILAQPEELNKSDTTFYEVEGIGYDFLPTVLDRSVVDEWYKTNDANSLPMARRLNRDEGILSGGSSGAALLVALKAARNLEAGQKCVVILPDGIRNYMSKFVSDNWMEARGFQAVVNVHNHRWFDVTVAQANLGKRTIEISSTVTCADAISKLKNENEDVALIIENESVIGSVTSINLINSHVSLGLKFSEPVKKSNYKKFRKIDSTTKLGLVARILEKDQFVYIENTRKIIRWLDLLDYIKTDPVPVQEIENLQING